MLQRRKKEIYFCRHVGTKLGVNVVEPLQHMRVRILNNTRFTVECERERGLLAAPAAGRQAARRHALRPPAEEERGQDEESLAKETVRRAGGGLPRHLPRRREQTAHPGEPIDLPD